MAKKLIPDALLVELRKQGYSDNSIKEMAKWYDPSDYLGVASY